MSAKSILVFCAQALIIQTAFAQCLNRLAVNEFGAPFGYDGLGMASSGMAYGSYGYDRFDGLGGNRGFDFASTSGGGLPITSVSPISPTGIFVMSDNIFEGPVSVFGEMPFVSAVAIEGVLPTSGAGAVSYGCGSGITAMVSEELAPAPSAYPSAFGSAGFGAVGPASGRLGLGGCGCGRGMLY